MVNPNAAYDKFKDKHVNTKGLGQFALQLLLRLHDELLKVWLDGVTAGANEDGELKQFEL